MLRIPSPVTPRLPGQVGHLFRCRSPCVLDRAVLVLSGSRPSAGRGGAGRVDDLVRHVGRLRRLPAPAADAGLAGIFLAAVAVERTLDPLDRGPIVPISAVLTLALAASLALRRRAPL